MLYSGDCNSDRNGTFGSTQPITDPQRHSGTVIGLHTEIEFCEKGVPTLFAKPSEVRARLSADTLLHLSVFDTRFHDNGVPADECDDLHGIIHE